MPLGGTFWGLVNRHLQSPDALKQLIQANRSVDVHRIEVGQKINIPRQLLKHTPSQATVTQLNCKTITQIEGQSAANLKMGAMVKEGVILRIPAGCQFALTLEDESTLRLMSGAVLQITRLRKNSLETSPEVKVELLDGRMVIDVPRRRLGNDAPFQVLTPTSVAGVRGTEFRVSFDALLGTSQVEVNEGAVGVRGRLDQAEKRTESGYGVAISASGQSLAVEKLLSSPRFANAEVQDGRKDWLLKFEAPPEADRFLLVTADNANFANVSSVTTSKQAQVLASNLGTQSVFYQWASLSSSGLMGNAQDFAVCHGYKRFDKWRCNVSLNMDGLVKPHLVFQKVEGPDQFVELLNEPVQSVANDFLMFRGLPSGVYRWRIQHEVSANLKAAVQGQFELIAIPGGD
jgi:hypothetical protein